MKKFKYVLGLDLGITSIGWAVAGLDDDGDVTHIVDTGVIITETMEDDKGNLVNVKRRDSRGARRTIRRRQFRVKRIKQLILKNLNVENIDDIFLKQNASVYELKVKGLKEKLTEEELVRVLVHYGKHRGFKSNRKHEASGEDGVIIKAIKENEEKLEGTISEYIASVLNGVDKIKNVGDYQFSFSRKKVEEEINILLDKQINFGLVDNNFKDLYLEIWSSQRDFSEGPGGKSQYKVDFASVFGYCHFDGALRAPRFSISQEINTGLSKLINLRYKIEGEEGEYKSLTVEEIKLLIEASEKKKEIKYADISKLVGKTKIVKYKSLKISKEEFIKIVNEVKLEENIEGNLDYKNSEAFKLKQAALINKKVLFKREANHILKKAFKDNLDVKHYENLPIEYKDDIVTGLTFYKTDEKISLYFSGDEIEGMTTSSLDWDLYPEIREDVIPLIPGSVFKESAALSLDILRHLNEKMIKGTEYSEAMKELGYDHSQLGVHKEIEKREKLGDVISILNEQYPNEISNPRVIRILKNSQNLIDACVDKYGSPSYVNIEVARDINLKRGKRGILENEQLSNLDRNERLKAQILEENPNMNYFNISKYDLEKYKLYEEQDGMCPYSLEKIGKGNLLTNMYQIDHIIPYSKSKLNTFVNKTLVKKNENHQKGDLVPLEFLKGDKKEKFRAYIESSHKISEKKKSLYLIKSLSDFDESFTSGAIEDTRFITKYLKKILDDNLIFLGDDENAIKVRSFKAGYINTIKKLNRINNLTHSLESEDYKRKESIVYEGQIIDFKDVAIAFNFKSDKKEYEINIKKVKESDKTPYEIKKRNQVLKNIIDNIENIDFNKFKGLSYFDKTNSIFTQIKELNLSKELSLNLEYILSYVKAQIDKQRIKKNRNNHLHHALDAVTVAVMTKSMEQKLAEYERRRGEAIDKLAKGPLRVELKEEVKVVETIEEFEKLELSYLDEYIPKPFDNFRKEVINYIYEQDNEIQKRSLNDDKIRNVKPLLPVIRKKKRYNLKGNISLQKLHKDTIYGRLGDKLVKRIEVDKLSDKKIEKIIGKDTYAINTYNACKKWLENKDTKYPLLPNGREIKKVKIEDGDAKKALKIPRGYVSGDNVVRIDIYKSKNKEDQNLYFLGQNSMTIVQDYQGEVINQILWYGQGDKNYELTNKEIKEKFNLLKYLHPGDLVHIVKSDNQTTLAYIKGFAAGMLEIESPIGDNYDLYRNINMGIDRERTALTVSTIKQINRKKINIMGEIKN